jgi:hypothetical protein
MSDQHSPLFQFALSWGLRDSVEYTAVQKTKKGKRGRTFLCSAPQIFERRILCLKVRRIHTFVLAIRDLTIKTGGVARWLGADRGIPTGL